MKKRVLAIVAAVLIAAFIFGCAGAAKPPVMQDGKQIGVFVLSDRGIKDGMKEDERKDRNEMGQFMEEDLIGTLQHEGYYAMLIQNRNEYVENSTNYLVIVKINDLRLVGRGTRVLAGILAGTSRLNNHYEISRSSDKIALSYDEEDSTIHDWQNSPRELNSRLVKKIYEKRSGLIKEVPSKKPLQKDDSARLQKLQDMKASGLITEDEYNKKRKEIIDTL